MLSTRTLIPGITLILISVLTEVSSFCQRTEIIDTSEYLPYYFSEALDNNLMVASMRGYEQQIEKLIARGADVNSETHEGATPLIFAVMNNRTAAIQKLLEHEPDINKMTTEDETPLLIAVKNNNPGIAEILIRNGADIDLADSKGATPLHYASIYGYFEMADVLLYYGADINKKARDGTSTLMAAVWAGYPNTADLLIQNGANLEARDKDGFTPLLIATQNGDTLIMNMLIRNGVDIYEQNNFNLNSLNLAIESNHKPAFDLLLQKGSKWAGDEKNAIDPYKTAASFGRKEMIKDLERKSIPGHSGFMIDEISISPSILFNSRDFYTGAAISLREPVLKSGFTIGFDMKPLYSRLLVQTEENIIYQYYDRSSVIYGGLFKDMTISESRSGLILFGTGALSAGYNFGPEFKGTNIPPDGKLRIIPSAGLKLTYKSFSASGNLQYMKTQFYKLSPIWFRFGISYNHFLSRARSPRKTIKWY